MIARSTAIGRRIRDTKESDGSATGVAFDTTTGDSGATSCRTMPARRSALPDQKPQFTGDCLYGRTMLHLIYTRGEMFASKRPWSSWREIQDAYAGYMSTLGPWSDEEMIDYLQDEYPNLSPNAERQISALMSGTVETVALIFR